MNMIRKKQKRILLISLLIIAAVFVWFFISSSHLPDASYSIKDWHGRAEWNDGKYSISKDNSAYDKSIVFLRGPNSFLKKGSYTVHIEYDAETDQDCIASSARPENAKLIQSAKGILSKNLDFIDYTFETKEDIEDFQVTIHYNGKGDFSVSDITLTANNVQIRRTAASIILTVLIVSVYLSVLVRYEEKRLTLLSLPAIALMASLPLVFKGIFVGHDLEVHIMRIEAIVQALCSGQFPARVSSVVLFGYGYPFSIYYNDIFLYLPAIFRILGFSITDAYKIYILFINLCKVGIAYYAFKKISGKRNQALIMTLLFSIASYRFTNLYVRAAVGEYTAQIFLPLFGLAIKRIFFEESGDRKDIFYNCVILTAAMSGFIGAHIPTTVMSCFILLLVCLFSWKTLFRKKTMLTLGCAVLLTIAVNLYFIVPMADYYFNVPTTISGEVDDRVMMIQENGIYPAQFFSFFQSVTGVAERDFSGRLQANPGLPLMTVFLFALYFLIEGKNTLWYKFILFFTGLTMWLSTDIFPWNFLTLHFSVWRVFAQMVQFPWRFLEYTVLFLTLLTGEMLTFRIPHRAKIALCISSVIMAVWFSFNLYECVGRVYWYDTSGVRVGWVGGEEQYVLQGTNLNNISKKVISSGMAATDILYRKSNLMELFCKADPNSSEHSVVLPLYNYKGYHVTDANGMEYAIINGVENRISFELPDGFEGNITVAFRDPPYWTAALVISAVIFFIIFRWLIRYEKKQKIIL